MGRRQRFGGRRSFAKSHQSNWLGNGEVRVGRFYGWRVVGAAFVLAFLGWGLGFYGPPVYLQAVREARSFSLTVVSSAVTVHFLAGAVLAANIPALYRTFCLPLVTSFAAVALYAGVFGWAISAAPWQR